PEHPLARFLADLQRGSPYDRISVEGLSDADVATLIERAAAQPADGFEGLVAAIVARTEGNPFFVRAVLRHLVESGVARRDEHGWAAGPLDDLAIPRDVREAILARLSRLSEGAQSALTIASVVGPEFEEDLLRSILGT